MRHGRRHAESAMTYNLWVSMNLTIQRRIQTLTDHDGAKDAHPTQPSDLLPFVGNPREPMPQGLPFMLADYLESGAAGTLPPRPLDG